MGLLRAIFQLIKAGGALSVNFVRLACSSVALPILRLAERVGRAAATTEQSAREYERRLEEQESRLK